MPSAEPGRSREQASDITATGPYPTVPDPDAVVDTPRRERRAGDASARREAERRLAAVVEGMSEAFLSLAPDWRVTYANREACRLNRTTRAELVGRNHWTRWPETVGNEVEWQYRRVVAEGVPARFEHYYPGVDAWHAIQAYPAEGGGLAVFYRDVTEQKRAEAAMRAQAELVELAQDAIIVRDVHDRITFWNPAAEATYGWTRAEAIGRVSHELLRTEFPAPLAEILATFGRTGAWEGELVQTRRDGGIVHVSSRWAVRRDETGAGVATLEVNRDVTATRRAEADRARALRDAEAARLRAEEANAVKAQFLATMSHELRTPLNAIAGYAQLMEMGLRGPVTPEQQADLARIQRSQEHLLGLVNSVLNYARLEAGRVAYDTTDVPLGAAVAAVEALVAPQMRAKGLSYTVEPCPPELTARADAEKLRQVMLNLLTNATKFTSAGGQVTVTCAARPDSVLVSVRDTGIGIPADKLHTVFDPFVQVGRRLSTPDEGVGLGLAISRDLARGMGGDLTVESVVGVGSTFTLTLPRA